jgi:ligand-binding sensor domain-containing protein
MKSEPLPPEQSEFPSLCSDLGFSRISGQAKRFSGLRWLALVLSLASSLVGLLSSSFALDPGRSLAQYRSVRWDEEQGLPQNDLATIAQTRDGFIWLEFNHGLIRFDGKNFAVGEEIHANIELPGRVFGLVPGPSGELWFGSYNSVYCRLANGEFKQFDSKDGLPEDSCRAFFLDSEGTLWISTRNHGLLELKDGHFLSFPGSLEVAQHQVYAMCETNQGLWIATTLGAYRINKISGEIKKFTQSDGLPADQVYGITADREGRIWAGTGKGLARFDNDGRFQRVANYLGSRQIDPLMTDSHGMIWVGSSGGGLWRIDPETEQVSELPPENGRPVQDIASICEDREGNIWVSTNLGLERLSDVKFTTYTVRDGLSSDTVTAVTPGASGRIWIGTMNGLACLIDGRIESISVAANSQTTEPSDVTSLHEDPEGVLWFALRDTTLHRLDRGQSQPIATLNKLEHSGAGWACGMCTDRSGDLWVATVGAGLLRFSNGQMAKAYTADDGLRDDAVRSLAIDQDQRLWIGGRGGVDLLQGTAIKATLGENAQVLPKAVYSLYADATGTLWAGTENGLFRFRNGRWAPLPTTRTKGCLAKNSTAFSRMTMVISGRAVPAAFSLFRRPS